MLKVPCGYCPIELATLENTLFADPPTSRRLPTTMTRMTANITAYFSDVLRFFLRPQFAEQVSHLRIPSGFVC